MTTIMYDFFSWAYFTIFVYLTFLLIGNVGFGKIWSEDFKTLDMIRSITFSYMQLVLKSYFWKNARRSKILAFWGHFEIIHINFFSKRQVIKENGNKSDGS